MHIPPTPTSAGGANHKTLLQIEAYLAYNLDITTSLIDATRAKLASIETQLATPAAAGAKTKRTLKNARARCVKKLRQCRGEAEMLTKALDEVKSQIAGTEAAMGSRISVVGQMGAGGSYTRSPLDGMSERSSSISSYISSAELSSGALPSPAFAYSPHGSPMVYTPLTAMEPGQPPYFHTNMPPLAISTHNLPSAPLHSAAHYLMSPYTPHVYPQMEAYSAYPTTVSWNPYTYLTTDFQHPVQPPVSMPLDPTAWSFQVSPTSDVNTVVPPASPKSKPTVERALSVGGLVQGGKRKGHRRGVSCDVERLVGEWDAGTVRSGL